MISNYSDLYSLEKEKIIGLEKWLDNEEAGLKDENQLQVPLSKAIFALSKKWGNLTIIEAEEISKQINYIDDLILVNNSNKKFLKFKQEFIKANSYINGNYFSLKNYVSLNYLLELKFPQYFKSDSLFDNSNYYFDNIDFIDEILKNNKHIDDKDFESFIASIADRNRVGIKEKSAELIINSIKESKNIPFEKVLFALGIKHVGETVAKKLAKEFRSIDNLITANLSEIASVGDVGEKIAESIVKFFSVEKHIQIINKLKVAGLQFNLKEEELLSNIFENKSFLFTGSLTKFTRDEAQVIVEKNGGKNLSAVSKNLDFLVAGEKAGSKLEKAKKFDTIKILTEDEFLDLIK